MADRKNLLSAPIATLLQIVDYERHFPDFPENFVSIGFDQPGYVPPHKGDGFKAAFIILALAGTAAVVARFWTRRYYQQAPLWWDDYTIVVSAVFMVAWSIVQLLALYIGGVGTHVYDNTLETLAVGLKIELADQLIYITTAALIKVSIFTFVYRITPPEKRWMQRIIIISTVLLLINVLLQAVITLTGCTPHAAVWDLRVRLEKFDCVDYQRLVVGFSITWSLTDLWALLLPMPLIWGLNAPVSRRALTCVVFALGFFACIASTIKIFYLNGVYNTYDPTWNALPVLFWHQLEVSLGIIAACLPSLTVVPWGSWFRHASHSPASSNGNKYGVSSFKSPFSRRSGRASSSDGRYREKDSLATAKEEEHARPYMFGSPTDSEQNLNFHATDPEKALVLVPAEAHMADITTTIAGLNPLPQPDSELYLQYPRPQPAKRGRSDYVSPQPALWRTESLQMPKEHDLHGKIIGDRFSHEEPRSNSLPHRLGKSRTSRRATTTSTRSGWLNPWADESRSQSVSQTDLMLQSQSSWTMASPYGDSSEANDGSRGFHFIKPTKKKPVFNRPSQPSSVPFKERHSDETLESLYKQYNVRDTVGSAAGKGLSSSPSGLRKGAAKRQSKFNTYETPDDYDIGYGEGISSADMDYTDFTVSPPVEYSPDTATGWKKRWSRSSRDADAVSLDLVIQRPATSDGVSSSAFS